MTDTTPTEKLAAELPDDIIDRLSRSITWLERGELLPGSSACIGLADIKALHALLRSQQPATVKECLTVQQPGQDERDVMHELDEIARDICPYEYGLPIGNEEADPKMLAALARLSAPQAAGQWLPIETAPKDGSVILLGYLPHPRIGGDRRVHEGRWHAEQGTWTSVNGFLLHADATHYMPLPPPPTPAGEGG